MGSIVKAEKPDHGSLQYMGIQFSSLYPVLAADFGIQASSFAIAAPLQTEKFYDISGALTYATCIVLSATYSRSHILKSSGLKGFISILHPRQLLVSATTLLWCGRLGSYLGYRIFSDGKDSRFDKVKRDPMKFSVYWFMQATWIFLTAFPAFAVNAAPSARLAPLGILDALGLGLWACGFLLETIADGQKLLWQKRIGHEARKTSFINEGVWTLSRHPNYFGEITLWVGNFLICASGFRHLGLLGLKTAAVFAISPIFVHSLICRVSGIPILEKSSDKRFGHLEEYQKYKREVPEFFPRLFPSKEKSN